jgi:TonB family protein
MKLTAVLFTVILLVIGMISCNTKDKSKTYIPEIPPEKKDSVLLSMPDHKEADSPKAAKVNPVKPHIGTIRRKVEIVPVCSEPPPPLQKEESDTIVFTKVEIEAEYPGGAAAWQRFLNRNLRYPQEAIDNEISGSIVVQFVVDKEGNVSNVERVSGPEILGAEAVRVIKKSGRWTPAVQGGRQVKSLKRQPFIICLQTEG